MDDDALVPWTKIPMSIVNNEAHQKTCSGYGAGIDDVAPKSTTTFFRLSKSIKKIAVIGPNANDEPMLWGNYNGTPVRTISILNGIKTKLGNTKVFYDKACDLVEDKVTVSYFDQCSIGNNPGFAASYWNNPERSGCGCNNSASCQPDQEDNGGSTRVCVWCKAARIFCAL